MSGDELVEDAVVLPALPGRELLILRPRDTDALLDEEAFEHEEFLPYWAELWPSARALADAVAARALRGARVVELGCGLGLPAIAAAMAGGRVLATDWSADAVAMAARNAERNGVEVETLVADWTRPDELLERGPFDLVIGSDLLYEARNVEPLLAVLERLLDGERAEAWIADPGRRPAERFLELAGAGFDVRSTRVPDGGARLAVHRLRRR